MTLIAAHPDQANTRQPAPHVGLPSWVQAFVGPGTTVSKDQSTGDLFTTSADASVVTARIPWVRDASPIHLRSAVRSAYLRLFHSLSDRGHPHVVRMWNHVPRITERLMPDADRYMVFNAGRFDAMIEWFGSNVEMAARVPAASGVGCEGEDLVIHALAMGTAGHVVENPAQVPAYRYSSRYGRLPPCFARAMRIAGRRSALLVSGTAAITGEDSRHDNDLPRQFDLTLQNLRTLLRSAAPASADTDPAGRFEHVRAYVPRTSDLRWVRERCVSAFPGAAEIELVEAQLCRAELLIEIEGLARVTDSGASAD